MGKLAVSEKTGKRNMEGSDGCGEEQIYVTQTETTESKQPCQRRFGGVGFFGCNGSDTVFFQM
jgi:hypothetical protein